MNNDKVSFRKQHKIKRRQNFETDIGETKSPICLNDLLSSRRLKSMFRGTYHILGLLTLFQFSPPGV